MLHFGHFILFLLISKKIQCYTDLVNCDFSGSCSVNDYFDPDLEYPSFTGCNGGVGNTYAAKLAMASTSCARTFQTIWFGSQGDSHSWIVSFNWRAGNEVDCELPDAGEDVYVYIDRNGQSSIAILTMGYATHTWESFSYGPFSTTVQIRVRFYQPTCTMTNGDAFAIDNLRIQKEAYSDVMNCDFSSGCNVNSYFDPDLEYPSYTGCGGGVGDTYAAKLAMASTTCPRYFQTIWFGVQGIAYKYVVSFNWKAGAEAGCELPDAGEDVYVYIDRNGKTSLHVLTMGYATNTWQSFSYGPFSSDAQIRVRFNQPTCSMTNGDAFAIDNLRIQQYDTICGSDDVNIGGSCYTPKTVNGYSGFSHDSNFYYFSDTARTFYDSRQFCKDTLHPASELFSPKTADLNTLYKNILTRYSATDGWIGVFNMYVYDGDVAGTGHFKFMDGTTLTYSNWATSQTYIDCVAMYQSDGQWRDDTCTLTKKFICQLPLADEGASYSPTGMWNVRYSPKPYCDFSAYNNCPDFYKKCNGVLYSNGTACNSQGTCSFSSVNKQGQCECTNYTVAAGSNCDIYTCYDTYSNSSDVCRRKGICSGTNTCNCYSNFTGDDCQFCNKSFCYGHGDCSRESTNPWTTICSCDSGYADTRCNVTSCFGILFNDTNVCRRKGECIGPNTCICFSNFTGDDCQFCNKSYCYEHGECLRNASEPWTTTCICETGYADARCNITSCFGILFNDTNVCRRKGICSGPNTCNCYSNFTGDDCQFCNRSYCYGHGNCSRGSTDPWITNCSCDSGYTAEPRCYLWYCNGVMKNDSNVCRKQVCASPDNCSCEIGISGSDCESCSNLYCNNHGDCSKLTTNPWTTNCSCYLTYSGSKCEIYTPIDDYFLLEKGSIGSNLLGLYYDICDGSDTIISSRLSSCGFYFSSHMVYFFGGYGFDANNDTGYLNDIWRLNVGKNTFCFISGNRTKNQIASYYPAIGQFSENSFPLARSSFASFSNSFSFFIFGGEHSTGTYSASSCTNDLWEYSVIGRTTRHQWRVLIVNDENSIIQPNPRYHGCVGYKKDRTVVYFFGGKGKNTDDYYNDLWIYDITNNLFTKLRSGSSSDTFSLSSRFVVSSSYALNTPNVNYNPPRRSGHICWITDNNDFYMFGGKFPNGFGTNDMWVYGESLSSWIFLLGGDAVTTNQYDQSSPTSYYQFNSLNIPSSRFGMAYFSNQPSNEQILFFGGCESSKGLEFGDVWLFSVSQKKFKFLNGSMTGVVNYGNGNNDVIAPLSYATGIYFPKSTSFYIFGGGSGQNVSFYNRNNILTMSSRLLINEYLISPNGIYKAEFRASDGNLVKINTQTGTTSVISIGFQGNGYIIIQDDCNLVHYNSGGTSVWHTGTSGNGNGCWLEMGNDGAIEIHKADSSIIWTDTSINKGNQLLMDERLNKFQFLVSSNGNYRLDYQEDGNLVKRNVQTGSVLWQSNSANHVANCLIMQNDCNLVIYDIGSVPKWASGTSGYGVGCWVTMDDDGWLRLRRADGANIWWI